ncbi:MAG: carboxymuconolactone decarboxylase family protein [Sterolibacteriaceae bacterium]|nr:carboxymuconolactone decarboxylase family protein [Sterolibacteriaceae bacterium]MBK9084480.1 carboxymuconolactone decarboxylase family protein [Sterolibacteriaceae bacterium]
MEFIEQIKSAIPDHAKDIRLNVDAVLQRSSLEPTEAIASALAAAYAARSATIVRALEASGIDANEITAAKTAAALMGMNNIWYPYVEMSGDTELAKQRAELRMNAYASHGGTSKRRFETYALAASAIGKCHFCVKSHYELLQKEGLTVTQLRDVGRIAAVINAAAQAIEMG